jgi:hypothetical protein
MAISKKTAATAETTAEIVATAETTAEKSRVVPVFTTIRADIPMPVNKTKRGVRSSYPFADLQVNQSFGITNKTAHSISSIISAQNRKAMVVKKDAEGNIVYKTAKNAEGAIVSTGVPEMVFTVKYQAVDVDPAKDADGATVRVFRIQ